MRPTSYLKCPLLFLLLSILAAAGCSETGTEGMSGFEKKEFEWRNSRERALRDSTSWLSIAGLYWLDKGVNSFGSSSRNSIILPTGSAPDYAGDIIVGEGTVGFRTEPGSGVTLEGKTLSEGVLRTDADGEPDRLSLNDLRMWVIERGGRPALRLRDLNSSRYTEFRGLDFYPPREPYRVEGDFVAFDTVRTVALPTMVGTETEMNSPGYVMFKLRGRQLRLDLLGTGEDDHFIIFTDGTSGVETYGACRFMSAKNPGNGKIELNFNRAVNPPCAYTPYATCPLPPSRNHLPVRIEAGEKKYPGAGPGRH